MGTQPQRHWRMVPEYCKNLSMWKEVKGNDTLVPLRSLRCFLGCPRSHIMNSSPSVHGVPCERPHSPEAWRLMIFVTHFMMLLLQSSYQWDWKYLWPGHHPSHVFKALRRQLPFQEALSRQRKHNYNCSFLLTFKLCKLLLCWRFLDSSFLEAKRIIYLQNVVNVLFLF